MKAEKSLITIENDAEFTFSDIAPYSFFIDEDEDLCLKLNDKIDGENNAICISSSYPYTYFPDSKVTPVKEIRAIC